jgi:hypothetical protein
MDVEEVEEEMDEEMDEPLSQNNDLLVPAHLIVASHTPAFIQQYTSAPISTPSTSATPVAPTPPPPPASLPPSSIPLPPPNHTHSEEAAVTLALENSARRKMLRKKYRQPNHVQHRGGKIPAVLKGKVNEQWEKKPLPAGAPSVSTPASFPTRAIAPAPPSSASAPLRPIEPGPAPAAASAPVVAAPPTTPPTHRAVPQAQVPAPTAAPSPIFLALAPGSSPSIVVKDEKMDDQSLEGEKEKDDGDSDMPTTILPPHRRVLECKACLFCRRRKIACKAAVVGFGESGANGACK